MKAGCSMTVNQAATKYEYVLQNTDVSFIYTKPTRNGALVQAMVDRAPR